MRKYRPVGYEHPVDRRHAQLGKDLYTILREAQDQLACDALRLRVPELKALAQILIEFAEDIPQNLGIWAAYEAYNTELFGVPLPFSKANHPEGLHRDRVRQLLWIVYQELISGLILSPEHRDLESITDVVCTFLRERAAEWPDDSNIKAFLETSNRYGWEIKRKLIWLGTQSYFFRIQFHRYLDENNRGRWEIGVVDDFLCQECTRWSGLGPIDILASMLDITREDRHDLRHWYERHASFYHVISANEGYLDVVNIVCDRPYRIRIDMPKSPFKAGQIVSGSLVPWRGEWYWSGEQELWESHAISDLEDLRDTMKRQSSHVLCRFWPEYEAQVRQRAKQFHKEALARHGNDLTVYPDGLAMAVDWQREMQAAWAGRSKQEVSEVMRRHGLKKPRPDINIPPDLVEHDGGIGVFLNPEEGQEILGDFTALEAIEGLIESDAVSPAFVHRVLTEYAGDSVKCAYRLPRDTPEYWLEYLLRSRKGHFYRKRYPSMSVVG